MATVLRRDQTMQDHRDWTAMNDDFPAIDDLLVLRRISMAGEAND
jgi:hypothetical protein